MDAVGKDCVGELLRLKRWRMILIFFYFAHDVGTAELSQCDQYPRFRDSYGRKPRETIDLSPSLRLSPYEYYLTIDWPIVTTIFDLSLFIRNCPQRRVKVSSLLLIGVPPSLT